MSRSPSCSRFQSGGGNVDERVQRLDDAINRFRAAPSALAGAFGGALVVQITVVVFYLLTAQGLAVPLPLLLGAVLIPVSLVVQMVPLSINGFGVREAVFAFFFRRFGLPIDAAVALSLVSAGLVMGLSLVGGFIFLKRRWTSPRIDANCADRLQGGRHQAWSCRGCKATRSWSRYGRFEAALC